MRDSNNLIAAARDVLPQFGLPADAQLTVLAAAHNDVLRVDTSADTFVLRFQAAEPLSDDARALQLEWMRSIRQETGLHVPDPVATIECRWFVTAASSAAGRSRRCVLLRWVNGERLEPPERFVTRDVLECVGRAVARLHQHASGFRSARDGSARELDADHLVGRLSCIGDGSAHGLIANDDFEALAAAASKIAPVMEDLRRRDGQYGLIHADLAPANWVFHQGDPRPIDFDEFGRGFFLFDLLGVLWSHV